MTFSLEDRLHRALGAYMSAPQWAKRLLGGAYRQLPIVVRRGARYGHFRQIAGESDPAARAAGARAQLQDALRWAAGTVPAFAHLQAVVGDVVDPYQALLEFPITTKADIKARPEHYLSASVPPSRRLLAFTGGSTAEPMRFYLERDVTRPREYAFMDAFHARAGYGEDEVVLSLRGRTVPTAADPGGRLWMYEPIKRQLILSSDHLLARWMPGYIETLKRWRPRFIQAFPSALYPLARWLADHPEPEITGQIRGVMLYSENVYDYQMQLFRTVFGGSVLKHYGHSERVLMAASAPEDDRYFFWPQYGHLELIGPDGCPVTTSGVVGEIVGTGFRNRVMPFVRYATGDLGVWSDAPVPPALAGFPVLERIEGRLQEFVVCRDGRLVSICTLGAAHFEDLAGVDGLQYEQFAPGALRLNVVASSPLDDAAKRRIAHAVVVKTQGGCEVEVVPVDSLPRTRMGKHVMLVQHLAGVAGTGPREMGST
jgi:phenylacetate-CoA ligase